MESWAYLQAASTPDGFPAPTLHLPKLARLRRPNWKRLSSIGCFSLLSTAVALSSLAPIATALGLRRGSRGVKVTALQTRLKDQGFFQGPVSGFYGSVTERAVKRFQASQGLTVDGIAGEQTLAALQLQPTARLKSGGRIRQSASRFSQRTIELQQLLANQGFDPGPIDGIYGSKTRLAVRQAQERFGLVVDGIAGPATLAALQGGSSPRVAAAGRSAPSGSSISTQELQQLLANQGFYAGPIDGVYGSATRSAVRAVQQAYGLPVDGVAGPATLRALRRQATRESGATTAGTSELQRLLQAQGFYRGPIDGLYNAETKAALKAAQQFYGLTADGIPGPRTMQALRTKRQSDSPNRPGILPVPAPPPKLRAGDPAAVTRQGQVESLSISGTQYLQRLLTARGFYRDRVDGVYGPRTQAAVLSAEQYYGLAPDGKADRLLLQRLEGRRAN